MFLKNKHDTQQTLDRQTLDTTNPRHKKPALDIISIEEDIHTGSSQFSVSIASNKEYFNNILYKNL